MIGHRFHNRKRQIQSFDTIESAARLPKRRRMRGQKSELNQERSTRRKFTLFLLFSVSLSPVFSVRGKSVQSVTSLLNEPNFIRHKQKTAVISLKPLLQTCSLAVCTSQGSPEKHTNRMCIQRKRKVYLIELAHMTMEPGESKSAV